MARRAAPSQESAVWHALDGAGEQIGPLTGAQLSRMVSDGELTVESPVWSQVLGEWARMCDTAALPAL